MTENPEGTLSLDQAVEQMMLDETPEPETTEEIQADASPEVEAEDVVETEEQDEPEADPVFEIETETGLEKLTPAQIKERMMLKADYTRKTMALAEERKATERAQAELAQVKQQLAEALQTWAVPTEQEPDWAKLATSLTPQEFNLKRVQWEQRQQKAQQARMEYMALQQAEQQRAIQTEFAKLIERVPEWRDESKFKAAAAKMQEVGADYDFSPQEIASIVDHRMVRVLYDAARYRELQKGAPAVTKKVAAAPATLKPGAKVSPKATDEAARQKQRAKLRQSGRVDDAIELMFR